MDGHEGRQFQEHISQRIAALREDIKALDARLAILEAWRNQVLGARKMGWVLWLLLAGVGAFIIELVVARWLATH